MKLLLVWFLLFTSFMWVMKENKTIMIDWEIISINSMNIQMILVFDWKSCLFMSVVSIISAFIMVYSIYYMEGEKNQSRFVMLLLFFIMSMLALIISPNMISMMLGWDGLGLTSYLLVVFYQTESSANSGMITIMSNRIGDATLLLSIGWMMSYSSYNFMLMNNMENLISFLVILSAMTKSAQIPFSAWLPAAMAAPTPVSALVHSSTLVTAGVYLLIRFSPVMKEEMFVMMFVMGLATMFMSGWVANFETDFKKVVALSTLSQLGLMFMIMGMKEQNMAFFHLIMHALFKSSLFMCAGFIIHNMMNSQDSRLMGTSDSSAPLLGVVFACTNVSLCGFPFMTGFYSKDLILENTMSTGISNMLTFVVILATALTLSYSIRVAYMTSSKNTKKNTLTTSEDFNLNMTTAVTVLFMLSILGGFMVSWMISTKAMNTLNQTEKFLIMTALLVTLLMKIKFLKNPKNLMKNPQWFSSLMFFLPKMTKHPMTNLILTNSSKNMKNTEMGWMEMTGPEGVKSLMANLSKQFNKSYLMMLTTQFATASMIILIIALTL